MENAVILSIEAVIIGCVSLLSHNSVYFFYVVLFLCRLTTCLINPDCCPAHGTKLTNSQEKCDGKKSVYCCIHCFDAVGWVT